MKWNKNDFHKACWLATFSVLCFYLERMPWVNDICRTMWPFCIQSHPVRLVYVLAVPLQCCLSVQKIIPSLITKFNSFEKATGARTFPAYLSGMSEVSRNLTFTKWCVMLLQLEGGVTLPLHLTLEERKVCTQNLINNNSWLSLKIILWH